MEVKVIEKSIVAVINVKHILRTCNVQAIRGIPSNNVLYKIIESLLLLKFK
jgi:hypothetical protein